MEFFDDILRFIEWTQSPFVLLILTYRIVGDRPLSCLPFLFGNIGPLNNYLTITFWDIETCISDANSEGVLYIANFQDMKREM